MEQNYISDDVFEQIKDFDLDQLSEEQKLLIDNLIPNEELKQRYKKHGLCKGCKQLNTGDYWCQLCNSKCFQQNFKNWTSGNSDVDKLIQESQLNAKNHRDKLEWIDYDRFEDIEYITKGGFGKVYKAIWKDGYILNWDYETNQWKRREYNKYYWNGLVALKCLNNSKDITSEFLNEINSHVKMNNASYIIRCYGITKDPETNNFMMVMQYARDGNLRQNLNKKFNSLDWWEKFFILFTISKGLSGIHKKKLIHQDFHSGNILIYFNNISPYISDLGLCKPADEKTEKNVYGVLPYVAPEVLRGKEYTQASDIYGFGIIIYEIFNGLPPYHDMSHDEFLAVKICQGLRPKFNIKVPRLVEDIFKQCVDADPSKRPTVDYLSEKFWKWWNEVNNYKEENSEIYKQTKEVDEFNKNQPTLTNSSNDTELTYVTHPQAIYTSRLLNFKNLPEPKNADDGESDYSESIKIDFANLNINS